MSKRTGELITHERWHKARNLVSPTCSLCCKEFPQLARGPQFLMGRFPIVVDINTQIVREERGGEGSPYPPQYRVARREPRKEGEKYTEWGHNNAHLARQRFVPDCPYCQQLSEEERKGLRTPEDVEREAKESIGGFTYKGHRMVHVGKNRPNPNCPYCQESPIKVEEPLIREKMPWEDESNYPLCDIAELVEKEKELKLAANPNGKMSGDNKQTEQKRRLAIYSDEALEILTGPGEIGDKSPDLEFADACRRTITKVGPIPKDERKGYQDLDAVVDSLLTTRSQLGQDREFDTSEVFAHVNENGIVNPGMAVMTRGYEACKIGQTITYGPTPNMKNQKTKVRRD